MNPAPPTPLVSCVMAAFDAAPWIAESLASLTAQTAAPERLEIIVVDDGSRDDTAAVARRALAGAKMAWRVETTANQGAAKARDFGVGLARGAWIQFLDADDLLAPGKIEAHLRAVAGVGPEVAGIYSAFQVFKVEGGERVTQPVAVPDLAAGVETGVRIVESKPWCPLAAMLLSTAWFRRLGGFDPATVPIEDVNLLLRLHLLGAAFLPCPSAEPLYFHRNVPGSLSKRSRLAFQRGCLANARVARDRWLAGGGLSGRQAAVLAEIFAGALPVLVELDPEGARGVEQELLAVAPGHLRATRPVLRLIGRVAGPRRAEQAALAWRRLRQKGFRGAP